MIKVGNGQADLFLHDFAVAEYGFQIVADVRADIQAAVYAFADTAVARGNKRFNIVGAGQSAVKKFLPCGARFRVSVMVFIILESLKYWNGLISDGLK